MSKLAALQLILFSSLLFAIEPMPQKGGIRFKMEFALIEGDEYYTEEERSLPFALDGNLADYEQRAALLEFEYGWENDLSTIVRTHYLDHEVAAPGGSVNSTGFPAIYIGLKQLVSRPGSQIRIIAETGLSIPLGIDDEEPLPIGNDSYDWTALVGYAQDFYPTSGGFEMDFGYRFRNGDPEDEVFFDAALKLRLFGIGMLAFRYHVLESQEDRNQPYDILEYPLDRDSQDVSVELGRQIGRRWEVNIGYRDRVNGRNLYNIDGFFLGMQWRE